MGEECALYRILYGLVGSRRSPIPVVAWIFVLCSFASTYQDSNYLTGIVGAKAALC